MNRELHKLIFGGILDEDVIMKLGNVNIDFGNNISLTSIDNDYLDEE